MHKCSVVRKLLVTLQYAWHCDLDQCFERARPFQISAPQKELNHTDE